jgi:hypothetical protein
MEASCCTLPACSVCPARPPPSTRAASSCCCTQSPPTGSAARHACMHGTRSHADRWPAASRWQARHSTRTALPTKPDTAPPHTPPPRQSAGSPSARPLHQLPPSAATRSSRRLTTLQPPTSAALARRRRVLLRSHAAGAGGAQPRAAPLAALVNGLLAALRARTPWCWGWPPRTPRCRRAPSWTCRRPSGAPRTLGRRPAPPWRPCCPSACGWQPPQSMPAALPGRRSWLQPAPAQVGLGAVPLLAHAFS